MISDLSAFVSEKRGKGYPWPHIANMAGRPIASMRPFMDMEAGAQPLPAPAPAPMVDEATRRGRPPRSGLSQRSVVLLALAEGFGSVKAIRARTGLGGGTVSGRLQDLKVDGHANQISGGGGRGLKAVYEITPEGKILAVQLTASDQ